MKRLHQIRLIRGKVIEAGTGSIVIQESPETQKTFLVPASFNAGDTLGKEVSIITDDSFTASRIRVEGKDFVLRLESPSYGAVLLSLAPYALWTAVPVIGPLYAVMLAYNMVSNLRGKYADEMAAMLYLVMLITATLAPYPYLMESGSFLSSLGLAVITGPVSLGVSALIAWIARLIHISNIDRAFKRRSEVVYG